MDTSVVTSHGNEVPQEDFQQCALRLETLMSRLSALQSEGIVTLCNKIDNRMQRQENLIKSMVTARIVTPERSVPTDELQQSTQTATRATNELPQNFSVMLSKNSSNAEVSQSVEKQGSDRKKTKFTKSSSHNSIQRMWEYQSKKFARFSIDERSKQLQFLKKSRIRGDSIITVRTKTMVVDCTIIPLCRNLMQRNAFDAICAVLLMTNAFFIAVQVDSENDAPRGKRQPSVLLTLDVLYSVLFSVELFVRITGMGVKRFFAGKSSSSQSLKDDSDSVSANIFDFVVVLAGVTESVFLVIFQLSSAQLSNLTVLRTIRVVRVVRVVRVFRLMRFFRPLRLLINAILNTVKSCLWTSLLLCMILYIFGILFAQGSNEHLQDQAAGDFPPSSVHGDIKKYFGTLPRSIFTCFKSILGGIDWELATQALSEVGVFYVVTFVILIVFVYLAVMNVISGLFLTSAIEQAQQDVEEMIYQKMKERKRFAQLFAKVFEELDMDADGCLTLDEFETGLNKDSMQNLFRAMGVEEFDAWQLFKLLDKNGDGDIDRDEFVEGCLKCRGNAKSIDIAQFRYETKWLMEVVADLADNCNANFDAIRKAIAVNEKAIASNLSKADLAHDIPAAARQTTLSSLAGARQTTTSSLGVASMELYTAGKLQSRAPPWHCSATLDGVAAPLNLTVPKARQKFPQLGVRDSAAGAKTPV